MLENGIKYYEKKGKIIVEFNGQLGLIVAEEMGWLDGMFDEYHQKVELIEYDKRLPNGEKRRKQ